MLQAQQSTMVHQNLANSTTENIELQLCFTGNSFWADNALEQLELYVQ